MADFPETIELEVTREMIRTGVPGNHHRCPVALALSKKLELERDPDEQGRSRKPNVLSDGAISVLSPDLGRHEVWYQPAVEDHHRLKKFIRDFDNERLEEPFHASFTLEKYCDGWDFPETGPDPAEP